ncbi:hypothetical protein ACFWIW_24560 [Amycolatopsis sp. NPDC058340]|uniref:hypothetical protein n=1 Tax=Amycolatopsis sp. NPDC058340 TaxID=3346453 RepID=UPI00364F5E2A
MARDPEEAQTLVLLSEDPDPPDGTFTHCLITRIPPRRGEVAKDGPGSRLGADAGPDEVRDAMAGHVLATGTLVCRYAR